MAYGGRKRDLNELLGGNAHRDPSDAIPDKETLQKAVLQWCADKNVQSAEDEKQADSFIKENWQRCVWDVEKKLKCQKVGLGLCRNFIKQVIKEYMTCEYEVVDVNKEEPCCGCGRKEVTLLEDGSNAHECVWMCEALSKLENDITLKRHKICGKAYCTGCSPQQPGWDHNIHPFYCPSCNNEAAIAESERLLSEQKEEDLVPRDGPKEKTKTITTTTNDTFHYLTTEISQKDVREMCGLKTSVIPSREHYKRCGIVIVDDNGIPRVVKFRKAKPAPENTVHMKILAIFATQYPKFYKAWHNAKVPVRDVKERIKELLTDAKNLKEKVKPILQQLQREEEALKKLSKEEQKKKRIDLQKVKYKELEDMKNKLERARELTRAAKKELETSDVQCVEQELGKWYSFLECGDLSDSDCSDDSGSEDDENVLAHMEDNS